MRRIKGRLTQDAINSRWDKVAIIRDQQIKNGKDLSFDHVLVPTIMELSEGCDFSSVIDLGCGPGLLTKQISSKAGRIVGIDASSEMIKVAEINNQTVTNAEFFSLSIDEFTHSGYVSTFSLAVANMTLMTVLNLEELLKCVALLLADKGQLVFTITHPCFWPLYHGYARKQWFRYKDTTFIEDVFRISLDSPPDGPRTIHIHRPIEQYVHSILTSGFRIEEISEPTPTRIIQSMYPEPWKYPRFLGMRCLKANQIKLI